MTMRKLATGMAAVAAIGAAAAGLTAIATADPAGNQVQPVVFGVPPVTIANRPGNESEG